MRILIVFAFALVFSTSASNAQEEETKIVGGFDADIYQYPYTLSFRKDGNHICGAALIGQTFALTAAHCTSGAILASQFTARGGSSSRLQGGYINPVFVIYQHPYYNPTTTDNDISVVRFVYAFPLTQYVYPIPLSYYPIPDGTMTTATGWGRISSGTPELPIFLRAVQVPIVPDAICKAEYGNDVITINMLCAGYVQGGRDTCQGDSGGPLNANGRLAGLTSWGTRCAEPGFVGVYTKVSQYIGYIQGITG